jgi:hypothetical protein
VPGVSRDISSENSAPILAHHSPFSTSKIIASQRLDRENPVKPYPESGVCPSRQVDKQELPNEQRPFNYI